MTIRTSLLAASLATGLFPSVAPASQHQGHQPAPGPSQGSADSARCAQVQPVVTRLVDAAMARLETARQANSPSQMRAAIEDLQGVLRDVRVQLAPCAAAEPGTSRMAPGPAMDHSTMTAGAAAAARPHTGATSAAPAPMDHSKMPVGRDSAARPAPAVSAKPQAPAAPMDHSKMSMGTPPEASAQAVDPVCGLKVDPSTAPRATTQGKTYSFCSEQHQRLFQKNPAKYLPTGR